MLLICFSTLRIVEHTSQKIGSHDCPKIATTKARLSITSRIVAEFVRTSGARSCTLETLCPSLRDGLFFYFLTKRSHCPNCFKFSHLVSFRPASLHTSEELRVIPRVYETQGIHHTTKANLGCMMLYPRVYYRSTHASRQHAGGPSRATIF
jgi:hypothetical protein